MSYTKEPDWRLERRMEWVADFIEEWAVSYRERANEMLGEEKEADGQKAALFAKSCASADGAARSLRTVAKGLRVIAKMGDDEAAKRRFRQLLK